MNNQKFLGHYQIEESLASNSFFDFYRAADAVRKRPVILKILKSEITGDRKNTQRFLEQAQFAIELVHPNLAWIWEAGEINGQQFLVERYIEGPTLKQVLEQETKLRQKRAQLIISQVGKGLDFVHSRGFAHGNVKPENIVIHPELGAILTDIGPSIALQAITPRWTSLINSETAPYTAPEIWQGNPPSAASDQYSLACIFAEMLSGEKTFDASSINAIKDKHLSAFQAPLSWAGSIPWPTAKAILRALDPNSAKRFKSLEFFSQAPNDLIEEINTDPRLREEAENQIQAWRAAEQKARQEAEEAARLEALEKARQEIKEELQSQGKNWEAQSVEQSVVMMDSDTPETSRVKGRPGINRTSSVRKRWLWVVLLVAIIISGAFWLSTRASVTGNLATFTPTPTNLPASQTPTLSVSDTPAPTATISATVTKTATQTKTATITITPTHTATSSVTATASMTITPTNTPRDEDSFISGSPLTRPLMQTPSP